MEEQWQRGMGSPYFVSGKNDVGFSLESAISRLSISSEVGRRHRQMTALVGSSSSRGVADVAGGSRLDPPGAYHLLPGSRGGNAEEEGLMMMRMMRAHQNGLLGFGGAHQDLNVGQDGNWAPPAPDLAGSSSSSGAASAHYRLRHRGGGEESPVDRFDYDHDSFLLRKKPSYTNPKSLIPNENSPLLRIPEIHYRKHQSPLLDLQELRGKVISLANDQTGCRILQHNLNFWTTEEIDEILSEVIHYVGYLMKNQSGSYLIQKLFSVCSEGQRLRIILALTTTPFELISICINSFGARAMQKMLEDLSSPQQRFMVMTALSPGAVTLACDTNGHLVVSYCLNNFSFEFNSCLINEIAEKCFHIATNIRGCRVLQLCVENACGETRECLVREILANAVQLSEDPYGNYVVQHLLEQNILGVEETLLRYLQGKFASLSCNKYSSNVVEKFFVKAGESSNKVIMELITSPYASKLLVDPFANYVIQKALKVATGELFYALVDLILVNASSMQSNKHGRKILSVFDSRK